ncbi:MAG: hypothetical protein EOM24_19685, partial [Chloroflexia bacterium]|nr:hypothetical protein [Chloroflexia bacterium]
DRLLGMAAAIDRDSSRTITWEELGIDMLIVDEAQAFKNLYTPTRLAQLAGVPTQHVQRSLDMRIKTWDLLRRQQKVVFLTATPIMNAIGEAYVMQLYLQEQQLTQAGIHHFDEWVSLYAQPVTAFEMKPDGSGFRMHTRLAQFINVPELTTMWRQVLTIRTKAQLGLPEPRLVTGKPITVVVPPSPALQRFVQRLGERAEAVRMGQVDPTVDNLLRIVSDGRLAGLDLRLVLQQAPRQQHTKIAALVANVAHLYHTFAAASATQLVFCDIATPKGTANQREPVTRLTTDNPLPEGQAGSAEVVTREERWLSHFVYHEIRDGLVQAGVPHAQIALIHAYQTRAQREELSAAMNAGRIRVLIGSTAMMSTGLNVQQRLLALHNLDCPWRPGDLEQRHGRILRQGNQWPEVFIFSYVTEGSFDGYLWQTIERKARFITQALTGELTARTMEDTADMVLSAAEVKGLASGNPQIQRKVQLEIELARLERIRRVWYDTQYQLQCDQASLDATIAADQRRLTHWQQADAARDAHPSKPFRAKVRTAVDASTLQTFTRRDEAADALTRLLSTQTRAVVRQQQTHQIVVAHYRGVQVVAQLHPVFGVSMSVWVTCPATT